MRSRDSARRSPNNIIARNGSANIAGSGCTATSSLTLGTDVTALMFKSPDSAPYDYHILHGSSAIDQATASTIDHDYDGDHRPMGSASDIGADEEEQRVASERGYSRRSRHG